MHHRAQHRNKQGLYAVIGFAVIASLVLRPLFLSLHLVSLPHAIDPHSGQLIHLHEHRHGEVDSRPHAPFEPGTGLRAGAAHDPGCDGGPHECPYNHSLHQPSHRALAIFSAVGQLRVCMEQLCPGDKSPFIQQDIHLLAPMNSPPV